jgi:hypothetical protein
MQSKMIALHARSGVARMPRLAQFFAYSHNAWPFRGTGSSSRISAVFAAFAPAGALRRKSRSSWRHETLRSHRRWARQVRVKGAEYGDEYP